MSEATVSMARKNIQFPSKSWEVASHIMLPSVKPLWQCLWNGKRRVTKVPEATTISLASSVTLYLNNLNSACSRTVDLAELLVQLKSDSKCTNGVLRHQSNVIKVGISVQCIRVTVPNCVLYRALHMLFEHRMSKFKLGY